MYQIFIKRNVALFNCGRAQHADALVNFYSFIANIGDVDMADYRANFDSAEDARDWIHRYGERGEQYFILPTEYLPN